jgi:hypothetical protein
MTTSIAETSTQATTPGLIETSTSQEASATSASSLSDLTSTTSVQTSAGNEQ